MATFFGLDEHRQILSQLCRICGERLMKSKDRYENSFPCDSRKELLYSAFGIKVHEDDQETCPPKFCHKCYKLASRGGTRVAINVWPAHKRTGNCTICNSYKEQQKPGRRKKTKPGMKPSKEATEVLEGMSGTLSFQPNENINLFCQQVGALKSYRGTEPLYPELFAENIKFEYICPICKEVLDQPVQTKCPTPHIFCASCLSFSITMCGPQCPMCRTDLEDPKVFIEPAPFVLQTIISELDFKCPTCSQTVKLHKLPQHEEEGCTPVPPMPTYRVTLNQPEPTTTAAEQHPAPSVPREVPPVSVPGSATAAETAPIPGQVHLPTAEAAPLQAPAPGYGHLTVQQLLHSPKEAFSSVKEEVGLFIIRQFLAKSQDGATILLKTGGQVNMF